MNKQDNLQGKRISTEEQKASKTNMDMDRTMKAY